MLLVKDTHTQTEFYCHRKHDYSNPLLYLHRQGLIIVIINNVFHTQVLPMDGCTDGSWNGKQYFKCPPGRALFCPLRSLEQDTGYMEPHQVPAARREEMKNRKYLYLIN